MKSTKNKSRKRFLVPLFSRSAHATLHLMLLAVLTATIPCGAAAPDAAERRPRIIVTTDGEGDDQCSFVRYLLYTNDFDTEALIYVNSRWHPRGEGTQWMEDYIHKYAQVHPNLLKHDSRYPSPEELLSAVRSGNLKDQNTQAIGPEKDTDGSDRSVEVLLDDDPRPVWLLAWGGVNTIAQALYRIQHSHAESLARVVRKARIHAAACQEDIEVGPSSYDYIGREFPELLFIQEWQFYAIAYQHRRLHPLGLDEMFTPGWLDRNVKKGHGPLGASYHHKKVLEGDSPTFLFLVPTGLRCTENPAYGGWRGRYEKQLDFGPDSYWQNTDYGIGKWWTRQDQNLDPFRIPSHGSKNFWTDAVDDGDWLKPMWRWLPAIANDFAARMDWCVADYGEANHPPLVRLSHDQDLIVPPGSRVNLSAEGTVDPDDDQLVYRWWQYREPGTHKHWVPIETYDSTKVRFTAPEVQSECTLHVIVEVTDNGTPPLTRYRRVIVTVRPSGKGR